MLNDQCFLLCDKSCSARLSSFGVAKTTPRRASPPPSVFLKPGFQSAVSHAGDDFRTAPRLASKANHICKALFLMMFALLPILLAGQQIICGKISYSDNLYEFSFSTATPEFEPSHRYDVFIFAKVGDEGWFKLKTIGGDFENVQAGKTGHLIIWEPYFQGRQKANYSFSIFAVDRAMLEACTPRYSYEAVEGLGTVQLKSNISNSSFQIGQKKFSKPGPVILPNGKYRIKALYQGFKDQEQIVTVVKDSSVSFDAVFPIGYILLETNEPKGKFTAGNITLRPGKSVAVSPNEYFIKATLPGCEDKTEYVKVGYGATAKVRIDFWDYDNTKYLNRMAGFYRSISNMVNEIRVTRCDSGPESVSPVMKYSLAGITYAITPSRSSSAFKKGRAFIYFGMGIADDLGFLVAKVDEKPVIRFAADWVSLQTGLAQSLVNSNFYWRMDAKASFSTQARIHSSIDDSFGRKLVYVTDFEESRTDGGLEREVSDGMMQWSGEATFSIGIRLFKARYLSFYGGVRFNSAKDGNWYLKSEVEQWQAFNMNNEPNESSYHDLPDQNFLQGTSSLIFGVKFNFRDGPGSPFK